MINKLIDLNFAPGIKAKDINYNFDLIHDWITKRTFKNWWIWISRRI